MSTLKTTNIKHTSSSSNNIVLASDGKVTFPQNTGNILQVVQLAPNSGSSNSFSTTSTSLVHVSDLNTTITPTKANSKLLILASIRAQNTNTTNTNNRHQCDLRRSVAGGSDSSTLQQTFTGAHGYSGSDRNNYIPYTFNLLDSPSYSLGQSIVYKFYVASDSTANTAYIHMDSGNNVGPRSTVTIMEVAA
tara:strand:- start:28 stop:600 length:573 start_codon:yes stop_codon:yes gene_type:complete